MRTTVVEERTCDQEKVKDVWKMYELCGTWNILQRSPSTVLRNNQGYLYLPNSMHLITDKTKQARQGGVISFHTPFMFKKGRTLEESDCA